MSRQLGEEQLELLAAFDEDRPALRAAALTLGVPRSTLSRRIEALEARLGQALFLRRGRSLVATPFGARVLREARSAQAALARLDDAANGTLEQRRLTVAASPLFAELILPNVIAALLEAKPDARIDLRLSHDFTDLYDEPIDVALRRGPVADSTSLSARRLGKSTMVCVGSPDLRRSGTLEERVKTLPWIRLGNPRERFVVDLRDQGRKRRIEVLPRLAVDSQRIAVDLAKRGVAAARVNLFLVSEELKRGTLVELVPEARSTESAFALYNLRSQPKAVLKLFLRLLVAECGAAKFWD
ncbi:MAG: LysR family transcriptional regulator [Myxococcota bacterium]